MTLSPYAFPGIPGGIKYINSINITDPAELIYKTSKAFNVHESYIKGSKRKQKYTYLRYMLFNILYERSENYKLSLVAIGKLFNRDHSTVIHGLGCHSDLLKTDEIYRSNYISLYNHLAFNEEFRLYERRPQTKSKQFDVYKVLRTIEVGESFLVENDQEKWRAEEIVYNASKGQKYQGYKFKVTRLPGGHYRFTRTC